MQERHRTACDKIDMLKEKEKVALQKKELATMEKEKFEQRYTEAKEMWEKKIAEKQKMKEEMEIQLVKSRADLEKARARHAEVLMSFWKTGLNK